MRICFISDTHCRNPNLPEADLLIHCGDLTGKGSVDAFKQEVRWLDIVKPKFPLGVIFVPGNHDKGLDLNYIKRFQDKWEKDPYHNYKPALLDGHHYAIRDLFKNAGITLLISEGIEIEGIKFYGSPFTPTFMDWAFMGSEMELAAEFNKIPEDTNVLITHGPPKYILDKVLNGPHVGSESLAERVRELKNLKVHAFGHIHEEAGHMKQWGKLFVNASILDETYHLTNSPIVVDTDTWEVC